jgi:hypothetical protein
MMLIASGLIAIVMVVMIWVELRQIHALVNARYSRLEADLADVKAHLEAANARLHQLMTPGP